ncbi:conserved hypothetical protein [Vibrio nigripulchritudo MADA3029]|uniref:Integral membrane protein n=2 Tax=Vibrio nigripulchritudo TaxID=28173 RepID=U4K372_9VIBR|nr:MULTISPECIES: hypothetical protein [Vibrio]EGU60653.1 hypothetical protein VINI7043_14890 [Vibrio nigripulchritudo ATCC 27043]KJY80595.1 membrane protein [Vibrio nigripulchritudo]UAB71443.1 hypothetical protein INR79_06000 [Vibrio sp. SCSIO 43132]CCN34170.1 conserved hypothetical protein [Vibrio nigripulchritudo AM115]CCN43986.1 conserved hypothetical protein [Vibrio nigripulchritudo FTn2]
MVFSTLQFIITTLLAIVCARAISMSGGDIPVLALVIPALWILPQGGAAGFILLGALAVYGFTLPLQPIAMSLSVWILFPLLMVTFSRRSSIYVLITTAATVLVMQVGIMVTQAEGKIPGSWEVTLVQTLSVIATWYAVRHWKSSSQHSWWTLSLILALWLAGWTHAALIALCLVGIIASAETLPKLSKFNWNKLLCWTLPTVAFAAMVTSNTVEIPNPVFVVWIFFLGTAWATDYILRSADEHEDA